jgi:hypothetical protein
MFCSSLGTPPQGIDVDYVWLDEEVVNQEWYPEMSARLIDRKGLFVWSATAQLGGVQLFELCEKAAEQKPLEKPTVVQYFAHIDDNYTFTEQQRDLFFAKLTPEQRRIRIEGEFAFTSCLVYPEFSDTVHGCDWFHIPQDWTRYMLTDPGRQVCAVLFVAVPPPNHKFAGQVFVYDELYITNCNAELYGRQVRLKAEGQNFYAFIIDHKGSEKHDVGGGVNIEQQYAQALRKNGVRSQLTGNGFLWGSTDVDAGIEKFRSWLLIRADGTPKFRYFKDKCPYLKWEITRYRYGKVTPRSGAPKPEKLHDHIMDLLRYGASYDPQWHKPKKGSRTSSALLRRLAERRKTTGSAINLGPGK